MYQQNFDFLIPEKYRGKKIEFPKTSINEKVELSVPKNAMYLDVNPLEDEEEFRGFQDSSDRQEMIYYNLNKEFVNSENLESLILTGELMYKLEGIFKPLY